MDHWGFGVDFRAPSVLAQAGCGQLSHLPLHRNEGFEIVFLEHGHLQWLVDGRAVDFDQGSVFYTFPGELHGSAKEYEPGHFWHFVGIRGDARKSTTAPLSFERLGFTTTLSAKIMSILQGSARRCWPTTPCLISAIKELVAEAKKKQEEKRPNPWSEEMIVTLCRLLLLELTRIVTEGTAKEKSPLHFTQRVQRALAEIKAHPEKKWSRDSMAAASGLHRTHFTNAVKHLTGDTPLFYLHRVRIERARKFLQTTKTSITEIAFACGFESSQHFARIFREFSNVSASEYRKAVTTPEAKK